MMAGSVAGDKGLVIYGQESIAYRLFYCARKTMEIAVHPDGAVIVKAPFQSDIASVEKKIRKRAGWILRQQHYFRQFYPRTPARSYVSGETHLYLGKRYRLKITDGAENSVKLSRGFFHVTCCTSAAPEKAKALLDQWYLEKARLQFEESLERCWQKFKSPGSQKPKTAIRRMQKRWGSLSDKGRLTLNSNLIQAPRECIEYVVTHELCHMKYRNHGPEFYALLNAICPDWQKIKHRLERCLA